MKFQSFLFYLVFITVQVCSQPKVLHLTFHKGCASEIEYVLTESGYDIETWFMNEIPTELFDGKTVGGDRYNIDKRKAKEIWKRNKQKFNEYDLIITSDTAPISRVFLQNNWKKPLVVWVCNRFDYAVKGAGMSSFPDKEYYKIIRSCKKRKNVKIISYTEFEHIYASKWHGIDIWNSLIKPIGVLNNRSFFTSCVPPEVVKENTFFVPPYHNDTNMIDLSGVLNNLGIKNYRGRYSGPKDLVGFKGIIHIPYAWSNLALFENMSNGLIYFLPSKDFLLELIKGRDFFWSPPFSARYLNKSEWYCKEHEGLFVYFDSWEDLRSKINTVDYTSLSKRIIEWHKNRHKKKTIQMWKSVMDEMLNKKGRM